MRRPLANLTRIRNDYPMAMHGVSLSIGSSDALNIDYLRDLKGKAARIKRALLHVKLSVRRAPGQRERSEANL